MLDDAWVILTPGVPSLMGKAVENRRLPMTADCALGARKLGEFFFERGIGNGGYSD
jgi:molybdopterin-biosynthesis enzyme MoeA-like protein